MSACRDFQPSLRFQPTLSLSPDGKQVAYADDAGGRFNLAVRNVDSGPAQRLTSYVDSAVRRVAWRPDGQSILFLADDQGDENTQLYLLDLATNCVDALTGAPGVQHAAALGEPFSMDGRLLAYSANDRAPADQDVLVRDMTTGEVRRARSRCRGSVRGLPGRGPRPHQAGEPGQGLHRRG